MGQFEWMGLKRIVEKCRLSSINEKRKDKARFITICAFNIVLWCMLFIPGIIFYLEPERYYMKGIGGESYGDGCQEVLYSQEFVTRYGKIKKIQIDVDKNGIESGGFLKWNIADKKGNVIVAGSIPYEEVEDYAYMDVALNIDVRPLHRYYINISFDKVNGVFPKMIINHGEERIWEGRRLFCNGEPLENMNFVWGIEYGDVIPFKNMVPMLLFSIASMIVFCLKDKWKLWMKIAITLAMFCTAPKYIVYYGECVINGPKEWFSDATLFSNCKILYLMILGLFLLFQSPRWTLRIGSIAVGILYIADFYVLRFRKATMKIWDIMAFRTAREVAGNYSYKISGDILVLAAFLLFIWSISYSFPSLKCKVKYRMLIGGAGIIYCILAYYNAMQDYFWDKLAGVYCTTASDAEYCYRKSGYLASFLFQIKINRVEKPENYTKEEVESILAELEIDKETGEKRPHIIVIVNESLADLAVLTGTLPEEPLTYMKSLKENTIKGYVGVSVLGGGTSDSEFEFITGDSMAFLQQGIYPFNRINRRQESLVWTLGEMGYETHAIHPASPSMWNRKTVYPLLGFRNYHWIEEFKDAKEVHFGVSDGETYQKVIEIYENRKQGEKQFIYDLTIQNHGGYGSIDVDEVIESDYFAVSAYLSLLLSSDRDLELLIEYFKRQPDNVIICIFGDHQPILEDGFYEEIFAENGKTEQENFNNQYKTPFWIWANYDIEEKENIETSLNYLGGLLFEAAGLPKSPYMQYISEVRKEYPVLTVNGYKDKKGTFYPLEELPDKLKEYERVQYYYMYDNDN